MEDKDTEIIKELMVSRKANRDWENIFNTINDAITIHDKDFNIIGVNKAAGRLGRHTEQNCINNDSTVCRSVLKDLPQ